MAKDEKQKEKHATNQFFRSLLGRWWPGFTSDMMRPLIVKNDVEK